MGVTTTSVIPNRQPPGVPIGGQFAAKVTPESDLELVDPSQAVPDPSETPIEPKLSDLGRDDRIKALRDEIDRAMDNLSSEEGWRAFLDSNAKFHKYSFGNQMLIAWQNPDATRVAGFNTWKNEFGRTVNKGEKALWILAPVVKKIKEKNADTGVEEEKGRTVGFRGVGVFDISQTSGPDLPEDPRIAQSELDEDEIPDGMVDDMSRVIEANGFKIEFGDTGKAGGWTDYRTKTVRISDDATPAGKVRTLAHEAAHIALGHGEAINEYHTSPGGKRPDMEVEAESVAYVLSRHYGMSTIGNQSFGYIDGWAKGNKDLVKKTAEKVIAGVRTVLDQAAPQSTEPAAA
jgi:hypothetical protein